MRKVGAIDYILADGSIVTVKMQSENILKYFAGGAFALLNTELTYCGTDDSNEVSVGEFNAAVAHVVIRLGDDSELNHFKDGTIGVNFDLKGGDD